MYKTNKIYNFINKFNTTLEETPHFSTCLKWLKMCFVTLVGLCNILQSVKRYVIEPKTVMEYLKWGIASSFHLFGHEQYPFDNITQNDSGQSIYGLSSAWYCS